MHFETKPFERILVNLQRMAETAQLYEILTSTIFHPATLIAEYK